MSDAPEAKPPPSRGTRPAVAEDVDRYRTFLAGAGAPTSDLHEDVALRIGEWGFYFRDSAGERSEVVAIDRTGHVVAESGTGDWYHLLATEGLDAAGALRRVAWLLGRAAPIDASTAVDPDASALVADPVLDVSEDRAVLEGWVVYPPAMKSPHRLRIEARPGEVATVRRDPWRSIT